MIEDHNSVGVIEKGYNVIRKGLEWPYSTGEGGKE